MTKNHPKHLLLLYICFTFFACSSNSNRTALLDVNSESSTVTHPDDKNDLSVSKDLKSNKVKSIKLITWNIQDLGQTKDETEIAFIVDILKDYDIVAIQEVVAKHPAGAQKVAQIADELNRTGSKWDYRISDPTKSPSAYMSERYAFLWKTSKVDLKGRAYLDDELASQMIREPYIANFKLKGSDKTFLVANFHSRKYSDNPELEIQYFKQYPKRFNTDRLIIAGDFNLNEKQIVWDDLYKQGFKSAITNQKTTLKWKCNNGDYLSHEIDNIYYSRQIKAVNSGVVDYVQSCEKLKAARLISDHLPVYLEFTLNDK